MQVSQMPAGERTDAVYERVREWILSGELAAGSEISQLELTRRLGVSRTPLREALRLLTGDGLVEETVAHRRVKISELSMPGLDELYACRIPCEALAIWHTVPVLTVAAIASMRDDIDVMLNAPTTEARAAHRRFHATLWSGVGSRMQQTLWTFMLHAERYQMAFLKQTKSGIQRKAAEHRAIVRACEQADRATARDLLVDHLSTTATELMRKARYEARALPDAIRMTESLAD